MLICGNSSFAVDENDTLSGSRSCRFLKKCRLVSHVLYELAMALSITHVLTLARKINYTSDSNIDINHPNHANLRLRRVYFAWRFAKIFIVALTDDGSRYTASTFLHPGASSTRNHFRDPGRWACTATPAGQRLLRSVWIIYRRIAAST